MLINTSAQDEADICLALLMAMRDSFKSDERPVWSLDEYRETIETGREISGKMQGENRDKFMGVLAEHQDELSRRLT